MSSRVALDRAPLDTSLLLVAGHPDADVARRLNPLGLRRGARVRLVQRLAAGGRIVSVAGSRVAVDARVLSGLLAEVAP